MSKNKELLFNLYFIIFELIGIIMTSMSLHRLAFEYYTEDSNLFALIITIIYVIFLLLNKKIPRIINILRLSSLLGLFVTFLVVLFILLPMLNFNFIFLFSGANFFLHLICPVLFFYIYMFLDKKNNFNKKEIFITLIPTFIYSAIIITLNIFKIVDGPYPFLRVYNQPIYMSIIWFVIIVGGAYILDFGLNKLKNRL